MRPNNDAALQSTDGKHGKVSHQRKDANLRLNITIYGQPAVWAKELKEEGIVRNNADLICQAVSALYQRFVDERLKILRLKTLERTEEDEL
jgi:hypothetical protein